VSWWYGAVFLVIVLPALWMLLPDVRLAVAFTSVGLLAFVGSLAAFTGPEHASVSTTPSLHGFGGLAHRYRPILLFDSDEAYAPVDVGRAIVWSRTDRPSRLIVEYATTEAFKDPRRVVGPAALEATDFTARVDLSGLPEGQRIFYRVRFQSLSDLRAWSEPVTGAFTTPIIRSARPARDVTIAWTADTVGQGWGINTELGGMRLYEAMRKVDADVFIHAGDTIYADAPIAPEVTLDDGRVWKNVVTREKSKVAETLDEFRGNHRYNLLDENVRRFNSSTSQFVIWDDHEVLNNWYPTEILGADMPHSEHSVALLARRETRVPGIHTDAFRPGRSGAHLSGVAARTAGRDHRLGYAQLPRREFRESPDRPLR
jgi:hypothetical protein